MEIHILGPVRVRSADRVIPVAGRSRVVLAALAAAAGARISTDLLIWYCWGERLPQRPRRALQVAVTRLRLAVGHDLVTTVDNGYALDVKHAELDLVSFRDLMHRAKNAEDVECERRLLGAALGLWSGEPLAGVPSDRLRNQVAAVLTEEWTAAMLRRVDLDLAAGSCHELAAELRDIASRHPLSEPIWRRLITALHRSGRRADAVTAYHQIRSALRDQLGIDPDPELRHLYQTMLR